MAHRHHLAVLGTALSATTALAVTTFVAGAAHADRPAGADVAIAYTSGEVSPFTSVLPECASGTVADDHANMLFKKTHGIFNGSKVFVCAGAGGGFTVHLSAKFDSAGSVGSWAVTDSWGTQAGLHGSGPLVGIPFGGGIADHYQGAFRF
jgi:hypothetical protein